MIEILINAIEKHEGYYDGSRSFRNANPGNLVYTPYTRSLGAVGRDGRFARFGSYQAGRAALRQFLTDIRNNKLVAYRRLAKSNGHRTCTIADMLSIYAPSHENDTNTYAKVVANALGVSVDTQLDEIF